jgi:large repetitive protein
MLAEVKYQPILLVLGISFLVACSDSPTAIDDDDDDEPEQSEPQILVRDSFNRSVASGWGWPDVGPAWFEGQSAADYSVEGGVGLIAKPDASARNVIARSGNSSQGYGRNVDGIASFRIDTAPDDESSFYTVQVYSRRDDRETSGLNYYRYRVRAFGHGRMDLRIEQNVDGTSTWLSDNTVIQTVWEVGEKFWIRWEAKGTSPNTVLRMRVWRDGSSEPSGWNLQTTVNEPGLDIIGTTGFRVSGPSSGQTTFPVIFALGDLEYREIE